MDTLVIGDVHGHLDRLEALLRQEGIIGECPVCRGRGDDGGTPPWPVDKITGICAAICPTCDGDGVARLNRDVKVIQLGDLGHFGSERNAMGETIPGSSGADFLCWDAAVRKHWVDVILWGNHDAAVVDDTHEFGGFITPPLETLHLIKMAAEEGRLKLAEEAHGFLLTHAGLHSSFKHQKDVPGETKWDPRDMADWLNEKQAVDETEGLAEDNPEAKSFEAIRDAIGSSRNGRSAAGGILWRDASEGLYDGYRQIFGHSAKEKIRKYESPKGWSYCIDVGSQHNGWLVGMWLPSEEIVEVKLP